jgi:GT2 family glycosyltransferase
MFQSLAIVIVNYNLKQDTLECIDSFLSAGANRKQIIVIDNASSDGSIDAFIENYNDDLCIIKAEENRGYPHALNIGIPLALKWGADWILLSNNDVIVAPEFFSEIKKAVDSEPNISLFSPMILYHEKPNLIWYSGEKIIPGTLIGLRTFRGKSIPNGLPDILPSDMVHGCAMLVHRKVFETIGLFDDAQLIYGDDADFSWRARRAGFVTGVATKALMWHKVSLTMNQQKPHTRYLRIKNTIQFYKRYASGFTLFVMIAFTFGRGIILTIKDIFFQQSNLILPLWRGWWNGWTMKSNKI